MEIDGPVMVVGLTTIPNSDNDIWSHRSERICAAAQDSGNESGKDNFEQVW